MTKEKKMVKVQFTRNGDYSFLSNAKGIIVNAKPFYDEYHVTSEEFLRVGLKGDVLTDNPDFEWFVSKHIVTPIKEENKGEKTMKIKLNSNFGTFYYGVKGCVGKEVVVNKEERLVSGAKLVELGADPEAFDLEYKYLIPYSCFDIVKETVKKTVIKVGDKVLIQPIEKFKLCDQRNSEGCMDKYAGTVMTVRKIDDDGNFRMIEDVEDRKQYLGGYFTDGYFYTKKMIYGKIEKITSIKDLKAGDKVLLETIENLKKVDSFNVHTMSKYAEQVVTVDKVTRLGMEIEEDKVDRGGLGWFWDDGSVVGKVIPLRDGEEFINEKKPDQKEIVVPAEKTPKYSHKTIDEALEVLKHPKFEDMVGIKYTSAVQTISDYITAMRELAE